MAFHGHSKFHASCSTFAPGPCSLASRDDAFRCMPSHEPWYPRRGYVGTLNIYIYISIYLNIILYIYAYVYIPTYINVLITRFIWGP